MPPPLPDLFYGFTEDEQGWSYKTVQPAFSAPEGSWSGNGLKIQATDNVNNFGVWESPLLEVIPEARQDLGERGGASGIVYAIEPIMTTSVQSSSQVPNFRIRAFLENFNITSVMSVESVGPANFTVNPASRLRGSPLKSYIHYFHAPGNEDFITAFDLLNFGGADSSNGSLILEAISFNLRDAEPSFNTLADLDCSIPFDQSFFSEFTIPGVAQPQLSKDGSGLTMSGSYPVLPRGEAPPWIVGGFEMTFPQPIEADKTYRVTATVSSDADVDPNDEVPTFRIRVNDSSFQGSWYLNIDSTQSEKYISFGDIPKEYQLYFQPGPDLAGNNIIFTIDYLWVNGDGRDRTVDLTLREVKLDTVTLVRPNVR